MDPIAPTPWRVLEAPADDEHRSSTDKPPRPQGGPSGGGSVLPRALLIAAAAIACAIGAFVLATGSGSGDVRIDGGSTLGAASSRGVRSTDPTDRLGSAAELVIEVVGSVRKPGVYRLPAGSRVGDAVQAAGGFGPRVDTRRAERELNLAAALADGDQVRVPSRDDAGTGAASAPSAHTSGAGGGTAKVDLNHATQAELEALPGIGPATAQKVIAAREEAPFAAVDELRSRGILGEKTFEKLRDLVSVG